MPHINQMITLGLAAVCLTACGVEELATTAGSGEGVAIAPEPAPEPTPTPTPAPLGSKTDEGTVQMDMVESGVEIEPLLRTAVDIKSAAPDVVGAFRFTCAPSHLSYDDPIVHPGKPGAAHLHQFFGNTKTDAHSTYESLRTSGESTCMNELNRSAYWMPALLDGQGSAIKPDTLVIYYKRRPSNDPWFADRISIPTQLPRGLRYVFGEPGKASFSCFGDGNMVSSHDMQEVIAGCEVGKTFQVGLSTQNCWDGKSLDSADHRSHVVDKVKSKETGWQVSCPSSHPYHLPGFHLTAQWTVQEGDMPALWRFSSDMGDARPGSTFHADWFGAWEDSILDAWHDNCIDKLLNCSSGNLGNGTAMKKVNTETTTESADRKVAIHSIG